MLLFKRVSCEIKWEDGWFAAFFFQCNTVGLSKTTKNSGQFGTETGAACWDELQNELVIGKKPLQQTSSPQGCLKWSSYSNMCLLSQCSCKYDGFFSRWRFSVFDNNSWTQDWVIFELWIHFHKYLLSVISMISICQSALFSYMCSSVQWEGPSLPINIISQPQLWRVISESSSSKGLLMRGKRETHAQPLTWCTVDIKFPAVLRWGNHGGKMADCENTE